MKILINILSWLNDNWSAVVVILGLIVALGAKLRSWINLSRKEKLELTEQEKSRALKQLSQVALSWVTALEKKWEIVEHSGYIKKSEFFEKTYDKFPVLADYADEIEQTISDIIDGALVEMREILSGKATGEDA